MQGKRGLIMGLANDRSLAWGIARAVANQGAELAFSYQGEALAKRVAPLAEQLGSDFLLDCDVFVFPSEFEGLGIALAEAMAAGCACVASNIRPLDEFVSPGQNGLLVSPAGPEALSCAVIEVLDSLEMKKKLGSEAKKTALELFEPAAAASRLSEIYRACRG